MEIAGDIVTVAGMASGDKYSVSSLLESLENEDRVDAPCTWELDHPYICRVLHAAGTCQVSSGIGAPGADESKDLWFKIVF